MAKEFLKISMVLLSLAISYSPAVHSDRCSEDNACYKKLAATCKAFGVDTVDKDVPCEFSNSSEFSYICKGACKPHFGSSTKIEVYRE